MKNTLQQLPAGELSLLMKVKPMDDGSVGLYLDRAKPEIVQAFRRLGTPYPVGKELNALSPEDQGEFDEWAEFVNRNRFVPSAQPVAAEDDHSASCHMLQYWNFLGGWYVARLVCDEQNDQALAVFYEMNRFPQRLVLQQLIKMKTIQTMSRHIHEGGHWVIDCHGHSTFLTCGMARILGLGENDMVLPTQRYLETIHPDDRTRVIETLDHIDKVIVSCGSRHLTSTGDTVHLASYAMPVYDGDGKLSRIFGYSERLGRDDTPRLEGLAINRDRFISISEYSDDLFFVINSKQELTYLSPNTAAAIGIDALGPHHRNVYEVAAERPGWREPLDAICKSIDRKISGTIKSSVIRPDGEERWYRFSLFSTLIEQGGDPLSLIIGHDITQEIRKERKLRFVSTHDDLTATFNRVEFWQLLEEIHRMSGRQYCLVILDINGLKLINHVYGQLKGDQVLIDVAGAINRVFPENRHVARISGDEFAVIVYDTPLEQVVYSCEAINDFCNSTNTRMLPISVAWGLACRADATGGPQRLFQVAESRMYDNKMIQQHSMHSQVVFSLKEALKARNVETADHMERMERMVSKLGSRMGLATHDYNRLVLLASLHDVGKLGIPDHIINKPGPLTDEEWDIMRSHTEIGHRIVLASPELSGIALETLSHHERWDGTGYPSGKKGEEIPLLAQIVSVVDSYDVMTNRRVYKEPISHADAIQELERCKGTQFSPAVTDLFIDILSEQSD